MRHVSYLCFVMAKAIHILDKNINYNSVDDRDILDIIRISRKGLEYNFFIEIFNTMSFKISEWSEFLHLSERTMQRYEKEKKAFDAIYAERIIQVMLINKYGVEVFGNKEKFNTWLETPNMALGKIKPKSLLDNSFGIDLLKSELMRIEHGILA